MDGEQQQRFVCPICQRTKAAERHAACEVCGEGMVPMVTWVRRQNKQTAKPSNSSEKE